MRCEKLKKKSNPETCFCKVCFNPIDNNTIHALLTPIPKICYECFVKSHPIIKHFEVSGVKAFAIYPYDDFVRSNLYQLKGCYDIELAPIFLEYFAVYLNIKYLGYIIIPAPSYIDADNLRGFNHVQEIFKSLHLEQYPCIKKTSNIKQSDMHFNERKNIKNYLVFDDKYSLKDKKVLLVDDVYTTGSTMKAMIDIVKQKNPKRIEVLVMSKVIDKKQN